MAADDVKLVPLSDASSAVRARLRELRNEPGVRGNMYSDHIITETEHAAWLDAVLRDPKQRLFVVISRSEAAGAASFYNIDTRNSRCAWAFYLGEAFQGKGLGPVIEYAMIEKAFGEMAMQKLNCEVIVTNQPVIKLHKRFGFVEEGIRRMDVLKEGRRVDVCLLGLLRDDWLAKRPAMQRVLERLG
jgi:UDP-4-amino-4,6-dideoxy-N-acetyl-beta-L-altrosamine N-acetyltransferase